MIKIVAMILARFLLNKRLNSIIKYKQYIETYLYNKIALFQKINKISLHINVSENPFLLKYSK